MGACRPARRAVVLASALLLVASALSGCSLRGGLDAQATDAELLGAVSLTPKDAAPDAEFGALADGDQVVNTVSLDLCFGDFPSESERSARNQVQISDTDGTRVSSEAILYPSPDDALQAMEELTAARAACPDQQVNPKVPGRAPLTWHFDDPPDEDWPDAPGVTRQAYAFTVTDGTGEAGEGTATYLQRGRMILALYVAPTGAASIVVVNSPSPARFTEVMANRLAALPEEALSTPRGIPAGDQAV